MRVVSADLCSDSLKAGESYAEGGAREARCRENESLGAEWCGSVKFLAINSGVATRSSDAATSAGMCRDWQIWQAFSDPPVCWWNKLPQAKYSSSPHAITAIVRRNHWRAKIELSVLMSQPV